MTHPEDLLAAYVDGTLTDPERAAVDAHLATCTICREEVELAGRAARLLAELPDEPVPLGVTAPVSSEIRRVAAALPPRRRTRARWTAGLAAAAVVTAVLAVALPRHAGEGGRAEGVGAAMPSATGAPAMKAAFASVPLETSSVDYAKPGRLQALAQESSGLPQTTHGAAPSPPAPSADQAIAEEAAACLTRAAGGGIGENDTLARLIRARFAGQPAYLGVYLRSPAAGQPPDKVVIWVASRSDCTVLSFTSSRI